MLREAAGLLFGEHHVVLDDDVELAFSARLDRGVVLRFGVQLGRETRGPLVVAVSDGAVKDPHARHRSESYRLDSAPWKTTSTLCPSGSMTKAA